MARKAIFLDRDGVLNVDTAYLYKVEELVWQDGVFEALKDAHDKGYLLIVVTNQSGVARGYYTEEDVKALHQYMGSTLAKAGAPIDAFYYCPHHVKGTVAPYVKDCNCRKPKTGMLDQACEDFDIDLDHSFMIGDKESDVATAKAKGIQGYLFTGGNLYDFIKPLLEESS